MKQLLPLAKIDGFAPLPNLTSRKLILLCSLLLCASTAIAQSSTPNFSKVSGTQLTNTNGEWVRVDPAQPNNIDLVETGIYKMPQRGSGIVSVEFKLVGGDGGTAHYQSGAYNQFANGGKGGEVNYTLNLINTNAYGKAFTVTFGKRGE